MANAKIEIPTVDIRPWLSPSASLAQKRQVVAEVRDAACKYGFFQLVGHHISLQEQKDIMDRCKLFYDRLTEEQKMDLWIKKAGIAFRGYEPPKIQKHHAHLKPDTKEALLLGPEVSEKDPKCGTLFMGPNQWPESIPDEQFRIPVMEYHTKMMQLVKILLRIFAAGLPREWGCPPDCLDELAEDASAPMRLLHYAPVDVADEAEFGVGDHTDFGCVTILLQEMGVNGLEVLYPPTGEWLPVPPQKGAYVINVGDTLMHYTNHYYRSARHRVVNNTSGKHRYSVPFFLNGKMGVEDVLLDGSGRDIEIGEHIRQRLIATMPNAGKALEVK